MSELRQRKLRDEGVIPFKRPSKAKQPSRVMEITVGITLVVFCGAYFSDVIATNVGYTKHYYAVIIDAGSSGSRVLAYKFREPFKVLEEKKLLLEEEYFEQSKPGLSSYADDPQKGAQTIVQLIKNAGFLIPSEQRSTTPLIVRATAGLRLLPQEKADRLIQSVREAISELGYDVGPKSVEIMDGSDEGIFIWYTVNFLYDLLRSDTMAALDLGGGSTQITYQLNAATKRVVPTTDQYVVPTGVRNISVYTHSYLKLGLHAARYGTLKLEAGEKTTEFASACVVPAVQGLQWPYANKQLSVGGASRSPNQKPQEAYETCQELVKRYVMKTLDWEPKSPPRGTVAAMSFFYEVAVDAGIIDLKTGGQVTVQRYREAAVKACAARDAEHPWACLDLTYIVTLLHDAYKIRDTDAVALIKQVDGHEVSWALGLAYTTLANQIAAK